MNIWIDEIEKYIMKYVKFFSLNIFQTKIEWYNNKLFLLKLFEKIYMKL